MTEYKIDRTPAQQIVVMVPDPEPMEGFEAWVDNLTATWTRQGWWALYGDNTGAQSLIVHPYQIDGLIQLLTEMKATRLGVS